ncbi:hypothetical protein ED312_23375 [Sinomicrobium pectinilyticum]|uniref:DUF4179 domain-containing protein n=1 Tax=Sinomicrobium pectinilyticum TaxID=1084421 RepID=A0A3N0CX69_SINP1|nr:hypothetical protein [Sinomicrobium pectinilyticum]RNL68045.1 hypothetical protein ED312_23375 [Sinomicrobium pectinilyticum]
MKKDNIDKLFEQLQGEFDMETPAAGHQNRFLEKLARQNKAPERKTSSGKLWRNLSIAASVMLLLGIGWVFYNKPQPSPGPVVETEEQVVYPELEKTRYYFSSLIETELKKIKDEADTEDTKIIVNDAIVQLEQIESDYEKLEAELQKNGYSKQLLNAMITNFQTRITLLQNVMEQIEDTKQLKKDNHEESRI